MTALAQGQVGTRPTSIPLEEGTFENYMLGRSFLRYFSLFRPNVHGYNKYLTHAKNKNRI